MAFHWLHKGHPFSQLLCKMDNSYVYQRGSKRGDILMLELICWVDIFTAIIQAIQTENLQQ